MSEAIEYEINISPEDNTGVNRIKEFDGKIVSHILVCKDEGWMTVYFTDSDSFDFTTTSTLRRRTYANGS